MIFMSQPFRRERAGPIAVPVASAGLIPGRGQNRNRAGKRNSTRCERTLRSRRADKEVRTARTAGRVRIGGNSPAAMPARIFSTAVSVARSLLGAAHLRRRFTRMHGLDHGSGSEILRGRALVERVFQPTEFGLAPLAGAHLAHDDNAVVPLRDLVRSDDHLSIAVVDGERRDASRNRRPAPALIRPSMMVSASVR